MAAQASVSLNLEFSINTNYNVQLGEHKYMGQSGTWGMEPFEKKIKMFDTKHGWTEYQNLCSYILYIRYTKLLKPIGSFSVRNNLRVLIY